MPHAESSLVPPEITTKPAFYAHIHAQLDALLEDYWLSNLAQVASLLYHSYAGCALYGLSEDSLPVVNWAGFYITEAAGQALLRLGPYHGRPACTLIKAQAGRGVCADAFVEKRGVVVDDVEAYPGHIACDGDTKSEIVLPLAMRTAAGTRVVGVLDLDSTVLATFDEEDLEGLAGVVRILEEKSVWPFA